MTGGRARWRERGHSYRSICSYRKLPPPACPGTTCKALVTSSDALVSNSFLLLFKGPIGFQIRPLAPICLWPREGAQPWPGVVARELDLSTNTSPVGGGCLGSFPPNRHSDGDKPGDEFHLPPALMNPQRHCLEEAEGRGRG